MNCNNLKFGLKRLFLLGFVLILAVSSAKAGTLAVYYVDPVIGININNGKTPLTAFRSIDKARSVIRTLNTTMTGDIYVYLRGGIHLISSSVIFDENDSGANGYKIIYTAFPGEIPIISGGRKITNWALFDAVKNIYKASAGGSIVTRQLFIDNRRGERAKSLIPLPILSLDTTGVSTSDLSVLNWKNPSDMELVYKISWTTPRCGINSISQNGATALLTMKKPGWFYCMNKGMTSIGSPSFTTTKIPWFIENAYEFLDTEGEWYLDKSGNIGGGSYTFFYKPFNGEDINKTDIYAPLLEQLIIAQGTTSESKIHDIIFRGISFQHTTWNYPSSNDGYSDAQNAVVRNSGRGERIISGSAVVLKNATNLVFERCTFTHLGGNGISMYAGCQNNAIKGCVFKDISANPIQVGDYYAWNQPGTENDMLQPDVKLRMINNEVSNNLIDKCAVEYMSGHAIGANFPQSMNIVHNDIGNMASGAIHVGWGWTTYNTSVMKNNRISSNYIHNILTEMDDSGGVYLLGSQDNTGSVSKSVVDSNYIVTTGDNGLYFDNGASWYTAKCNVVDDANVNINISTADKFNITVTNTYSNKNQFWNKGTNCIVQTPLVTTDDNWPATAKVVMTNAGLSSEYTDIRTLKVLSENYNSTSIGTIPSGWVTENASGVISTVDLASLAGDRSVCFNKSTSGQSIKATRAFEQISGKVIVEYNLRCDQTSGYKLATKIVDHNGIVATSLSFSNGSILLDTNVGNPTIVQSYITGNWYKIKLVLNTDTKKTDLYINDILKISQATLLANVSNFASLQLSIDANSIGTSYFDNLNASADKTDLFYSFSNSLIDKNPIGWTSNTNTVKVDSIPGNRFLRIAGASCSYNTFNPMFNTVSFSALVNFKAITGTKTVMQVADRKSVKAFELKLVNGTLQAQNGTAYTTVQTVKADTWYLVKIVANVGSDKYDVYINDTLKISHAVFLTKVANLSKIGFLNDGAGDILLDNIQGYNMDSTTINTLLTNVEQITLKNEYSLRLLSNPINSGEKIRFFLNNTENQKVKISLISMTGNVLKNMSVNAEGYYDFNSDHLLPGLYFLNALLPNKNNTVKFLII